MPHLCFVILFAVEKSLCVNSVCLNFQHRSFYQSGPYPFLNIFFLRYDWLRTKESEVKLAERNWGWSRGDVKLFKAAILKYAEIHTKVYFKTTFIATFGLYFLHHLSRHLVSVLALRNGLTDSL